MTKTLELPIADDYEPTPGELDNFVYLTSKYTVGWIPRAADHAVCLMMAGMMVGGNKIVGNEGLTKLCEVTCEYLWDHICGEPEGLTAEDMFTLIKPMLQAWYNNSTPEERADTGLVESE
jgi:hypothetical protein